MKRRVIALGFFDGVHLGHGALLRQTVQRAQELEAEPCVLSFDTHPEEVIFPGRSMPLINTQEDREYLLRSLYGIQETLLLHFDSALMSMDWQDFVRNILLADGAVHLVAGEDYRFGYRGLGTAARLKEFAGSLGIGCDIVPEVRLDGEIISSTLIRGMLAQGDLEQAARYLGHPHVLSGDVVHGHALGRTLGIPTANLRLPKELQPLPFGVYACVCILPDGTRRPAVANIGIRPTVSQEHTISVEPWILDYSADLYGKRIVLLFYKMLRPEQKFRSTEELQSVIRRNAEETRTYFAHKEIVFP